MSRRALSPDDSPAPLELFTSLVCLMQPAYLMHEVCVYPICTSDALVARPRYGYPNTMNSGDVCVLFPVSCIARSIGLEKQTKTCMDGGRRQCDC